MIAPEMVHWKMKLREHPRKQKKTYRDRYIDNRKKGVS